MTGQTEKDPTIWGTLRKDVKQGDFFQTLRDEAQELRDFYINEERRDELRRMSPVKRWFLLAWWILKSMFFKLTPMRRILLAFGILLIISPTATFSNHSEGISQNVTGTLFVGVLALLLVLMLELKDKLLAHSELQDGRAIQRAMQPDPSPSVPGWSIWLYTYPANEVCGDIIDFFPFSGNRYGMATGDVAGKGLGAALLMVRIQALLRAFAPDIPALETLAAKINEILLRDKMPGRFASLLLLQIAPDSGVVRYVNAGHMPPLLVSQTGITSLGKGNAAIGLAADALFEQKECTLTRGQTLVLYSDGITEAENREGESYGVERLEAACRSLCTLQAQQFGEALVARVEAFVADCRRKDDISLIILQRTL
jgi:serine phosphatase RsbU (regulator of sigma subunit)